VIAVAAPLISELPAFVILAGAAIGTALRVRTIHASSQLPVRPCVLLFIVAITEVGLATGRMQTDSAAALVGAAVFSVLIFPLVALAVRRRTQPVVLTTK